MLPLTLHEAAALAGRHAWWEQRLFELAGRWAAAEESAVATVALAVQANLHAARAEQWHRRLPALTGWDPDALTAAPRAALPAAVERLAGDLSATSDRLVALYRVLLPARLTAYRAHLARTSPVCDGPVIRVLEGAMGALPAEVEAGRAVLDAVAGTEGEGRAAIAERRCRDLLRLV